MKNLLIILILFTLTASKCEEEPLAYQAEPSIQLLFDPYHNNFLTYSESENQGKHLAKNSEYPGIDMNANSTRFWIYRENKVDSFTLNYTLKTFGKAGENWIDFDTLYVSQTTFFDADINFGMNQDPRYFRNPVPRIYFIKL